MFLQPIQRASGATPIWRVLSTPAMVPMVWVPWLLSSQGSSLSRPQGLFSGLLVVSPFKGFNAWMASCQL